MGRRDFLEREFREARFDLLTEGLVPFFVRAARADQKKSALGEILAELLPLLLGERKILVMGCEAKSIFD